MRRNQRWLITILLLLLPTVATAVSMERMDVTVRDDTVRATMVAHLQAEPEQVRTALTSFEQLDRIDPRIQDAEVLARNGRNVRVRTEVRQCLGIFCRELTRVEALHIGDKSIRARIRPEASDFRSGRTLWLITAANGGTRLEVRIRLTPEESVPGLLNAALAENMREQLRGTLDRLEGMETIPTQAQAGGG